MDNIKDLSSEIMDVVERYNFNHMPTRLDLEGVGEGALSTRVQRNGGFVYWREKLNLNPKVKRTKWTNEKIKLEIERVVKLMEENSGVRGYMPTADNTAHYTGSYSLSNAISRSGGYRHWADKLGLEYQDSTYDMGYNYEKLAYEKLVSMGYEVEFMSQGYPYDLLVNGVLKIDVKSCRASLSKGFRTHVIGIEKSHPTCDIYYMFCMNEDESILEKELIAPSHHIKTTTINMGENSKYDIYHERFNYIEEYLEFMDNI